MRTPSRKKYSGGNASGSGTAGKRAYTRKDSDAGKSRGPYRKPADSGDTSEPVSSRGGYRKVAGRDTRSGRPGRASFSKDKGAGRESRKFNPHGPGSGGLPSYPRNEKPARSSFSKEKEESRGERKYNSTGSNRNERGSFTRSDRPDRLSFSKEKGEGRGPRKGSTAETGRAMRSTYPRTDRPDRSSFSKGSDESKDTRKFTSPGRESDRKPAPGSMAAWRSGQGKSSPKSEQPSYPRTERKFSTDRAGRQGDEPAKKAGTGYSGRRRTSTFGAGKGLQSAGGAIRLNKYIAEHGLCSRREADTYIISGVISVNGQVVTELGTKVSPADDVRFNGQRMREERKVYLLLNKPKDYVTSTDDPHAKKTVMELIAGACKERVYPVGRLDRNTTGVLLFTNDGDLTKRISHPSYNKKKIYHVFLDNRIRETDMRKLTEGFELEDGFIKADTVSYVDPEDKTQVGVEIHSGRNRIVRRMFEFMGYQIKKLDRVYYAGLTKKSLPRGHWRFLTEKEIKMLKTGAFE